MGRVTGVLVEHLDEQWGVVLTREGEFRRVRLPRGGAGSLALGVEIEGVAGWGWPWKAGTGWSAWRVRWPATAVATAVAFGAAGAVFAAVYFNGALWPRGAETVPQPMQAGRAERAVTGSEAGATTPGVAPAGPGAVATGVPAANGLELSAPRLVAPGMPDQWPAVGAAGGPAGTAPGPEAARRLTVWDKEFTIELREALKPAPAQPAGRDREEKVAGTREPREARPTVAAGNTAASPAATADMGGEAPSAAGSGPARVQPASSTPADDKEKAQMAAEPEPAPQSSAPVAAVAGERPAGAAAAGGHRLETPGSMPRLTAPALRLMDGQGP